MGATLEETLAEIQQKKSRAGAPSSSSQSGGSSAAGSGGGGANAPGTPSPAYIKANTTPDGDLNAGASRGVSGLGMGISDEIGGFLSTVTGLDNYGEQRAFWNHPAGFSGALADNIAIERARDKWAQENYSKSYIAGEIAGGVFIPIGRGAKGVQGFAKAGLQQGALYGFGSGEGMGRVTGAVTGGAIGLAAGGVLGKGVDLLGKGAARLFPGWAAKRAATAAAEAEGAVVPKVKIIGTNEDGQPILGAITDDVGDTVESVGVRDFAAELQSGDATADGLAALQREVADGVDNIKAGGDRAVDITWEQTPATAKAVGEWRLGNLSTDEEATALASALVKTMPPRTRRTDAELVASVTKTANEIGVNPEEMLLYAQKVAGNLEDVDVAAYTVKTLFGSTSSEISQLYLTRVNWATASPELLKEAGQRIYNASALGAELLKVKAGLAGGLRVNKLPPVQEYLAQIEARAAGVVDDVVDPEAAPLPTQPHELQDFFDMWGMTGGDSKLQLALLQGKLGQMLPKPGMYVRESLVNLFTANILSSGKTVVLNIAGPAILNTFRTGWRIMGAAEVAIRPDMTLVQRKEALAVAASAFKAYTGMFTQINSAFKQAVLAAQVNHTLIGGGGTVTDAFGRFGPFTSRFLEATGQEFTLAQRGGFMLGNVLNFFPKAFARLNNGLDEFAKRMVYSNEVMLDSLVEAQLKGLPKADVDAFVQQRMVEAFNKEGAATRANLLRSAERSTLTSTPGEEGSMLRGFSNGMINARKAVPELRFIIPVWNVAVNSIAETMRMLPLSRVPIINKMMDQTRRELAGEFGPVAQADAHGRTMLAGMFLAGGAYLNDMGLLTGAAPRDPTDRAVWLTTHQPYSIRIARQWVSYAKLDVAGALLSIPATIRDMTVYHPDDKAKEDAMWTAMGALTQWFTDRAALRTAAGILSLTEGATGNIQKKGEQVIGSIVSGLTTPAFLRTLVTDTTSPYVAMKRGWEDYVLAAMPIAANTLELRRNVLGEPIRKANDTVAEGLLPVSLVKAIGYDEDPVLDELDRLYQETGYATQADPSSAVAAGFFDPVDAKLEDGTSLYTAFTKARQTFKIDNKTLRQDLTELFASEVYNKAVDGDSSSKTTSRGELSRGWLAAQVFNRYNKGIKASLAAVSPAASDWMTAGAAKKRDDAYLRNHTAKELVDNPDLYAANGVDKQAYSGALLRGSDIGDLYTVLGGGQ